VPLLKISTLLLFAVGCYEYTSDLLCLDSCRQSPEPASRAYGPLQKTATPLVLPEWEQALARHPDRAFVRYINEKLHMGFRIGFQVGSPLPSATINMRSALEHPEVIDNYLKGELTCRRMLGPFADADQLPSLHINRFGMIPKGHNSGMWRLITDLSHPQGASVNDAIDPELCSLSYVSVDEVADLVAQLSHGSLMAKVDIESAYRLIPVHP